MHQRKTWHCPAKYLLVIRRYVMNKPRRAFEWALTNALFAIVIALGIFANIEWARWLVVAFVWLLLVLNTVVLLSDESTSKFAHVSEPFPRPIGRVLDVLFTAAMVYGEWHFTAAAYVTSCVVLSVIYSGVTIENSTKSAQAIPQEVTNGNPRFGRPALFFLGLYGLVLAGYLQAEQSETRREAIGRIEFRRSLLHPHMQYSPDMLWAQRLRSDESDPIAKLFAGSSVQRLRTFFRVIAVWNPSERETWSRQRRQAHRT